MGLDVYFSTVTGGTGKKIINLDDEFRGRDLYTIIRFAEFKKGIKDRAALNVTDKNFLENGNEEELLSDWFIAEQQADRVWSGREELEELIAAVEEFTEIMADEERRHELIEFTVWHGYYPDADFDFMWWVKNPVEYFKQLAEDLKEALNMAIDSQGYFQMWVSY